MKILNECSFLDSDKIEAVEKKYNAKYIFESCIKGTNGWCNFPAAIFYTDEAHPHGSNYFAMYIHPERNGLMITNGITATEPVYTGLKIGDDIIYSRYRHDFRSFGGSFVDGGRDYFRFSGKQEDMVNFKVSKDKLEIVDAN